MATLIFSKIDPLPSDGLRPARDILQASEFDDLCGNFLFMGVDKTGIEGKRSCPFFVEGTSIYQFRD